MSTAPAPTLQSSIFDNRSRGAAGDFLKKHIRTDSDLSFVSAYFTVPGLGLKPSGNNVELNIAVDSRRDVEDLKAWFDELWTDTSVTTDVREEVLAELDRLYSDNSPEFIYYLTLFHLFRHYIDRNDDVGDTLTRTALPDTGIWNALFSSCSTLRPWRSRFLGLRFR